MRYTQDMLVAVESKEYMDVNENKTGGDEDDL